MTSFEDLEVGHEAEIGSHTFTAGEIVAFARRWDPQPFHIDAEAAEKSLFGGLCASGWHTACVWMRLNVEYGKRLAAEALAAGREPPRFGPSPGISNLKWPRPVYVGDTITYRWRISGKRPLASRPQWGLVQHEGFAVNQDGQPVLSFEGKFFMGRRRA